MEADWDVEIGADAPSIAVPWEGFVDLRIDPVAAAHLISEAANYPALRHALVTLNSAESRVFTSKCDVWRLKSEEIDPDEFGARRENASFGFASYIDTLLVDPQNFRSFEIHEILVRDITRELWTGALANGRVDLVIRPAIADSSSGCGITIYAAGCGPDEPAAHASWEAMLQAAVNATMKMTQLPPARASSSIG